MRRRATVLLVALLAAAPSLPAEPTAALFAAARAGAAAEVARLLDAGVAIDAIDRYGSTALSMAASAGRLEVVRLLVERGADVNHAESFYGARPLDLALFFRRHDEVAAFLLRHGAESRDNALGQALQDGNLELARAAVAGGPITASRVAAFRPRAEALGPEFSRLLAAAETRPDPAPPRYDLPALHEFTGSYEGWTSDTRLEIALVQGRLLARLDDGEAAPLAAVAERTFESPGGLRAAFNGRAGTVEGVFIAGGGRMPELLRRSVAEPDPEAAARFRSLRAEPGDRVTVHWPAFRGANADGIGDGRETPAGWDPASGAGLLWQAELPGLGNSSPVVWGDRVFVTTAVASGLEQNVRTGLTGAGDGVDEPVEHSWRVLAFSKWTGEKLWETEVGRGLPLTRRHFKASQANSTPATDGERLVVVFPTAGLACLDLDGRVLWRHDLGGLNAGAFNDPTIEWGFASSPVIYGDLAVLQVDVHGGPYLAAWRLEDGELAWRVERDVDPSWATPTLVRGAAGDELVTNASTIHAYDPRTGEELWSLAPNSALVVATPVADGGVVYVSAGYPPVKPIYAVRAGARGALRVEPGEAGGPLVWSHGRGGAYMPTPLLYRGLLYIVHHNGRIVAYDPADGSALYKQRFSRGGTFTASPVAANGRLYVATEEGLLYVLEAGAEYKELAVVEHGEPLMATPAISEGLLLVRTPRRLLAAGAPPAESPAALPPPGRNSGG